MAKDGWTVAEIAARFRTSKSAVSRKLADREIYISEVKSCPQFVGKRKSVQSAF